MEIHHVAYAVSNIEKALAVFETLGCDIESPLVEDMQRDVAIQFITFGGYRIELVAPLSDDAPVSPYLKNNKGAGCPYHICYEVDSISESVDELKKSGLMKISNIAPAPAIDGRDVVFLYNRKIGLIELVER